MDRDTRRPHLTLATRAVAAQGGERAGTVLSVALFATGLWWLILHWGGLALGITGDAAWLAPALVAIFALLMIGLSIAAFAAHGAELTLGAAHVTTVAVKHQVWRNSSNFRANRRANGVGRNFR